MFGLNKKDQDALLDDVVQMGRRMRESLPYVPPGDVRQADEAIRNERSQNIKLAIARNSQRDVTEAALSQLRQLYGRRWDLRAQIEAAWPVSEDALQETARAMRKPLDAVQGHVYAFMRECYDDEIGRRLALGLLRRDPRKQGSLWHSPRRVWYSVLREGPEPDPVNPLDKASLDAAAQELANAEAALASLRAQPEPATVKARQPLWLKTAQTESWRLRAETAYSRLVFEDTRFKQSVAVYYNHDHAACLVTIMTTLDDVLQHLAETTGQSVEAVQRQPYASIRQGYDVRIDAAIQAQQLRVDPRRQLELWVGPHRDWYPAEDLRKRADLQA